MSRRSNFPRRPQDAYLTIDPRAVAALLPHLAPGTHFIEPCCGQGHLVAALVDAGHVCDWMSDLPTDALTLPAIGLVITNPPWTRVMMHALIEHWRQDGCWCLFDASWAHTGQARELMAYCSDIVVVGRLLWIEGTTMRGKDDCCWYRFQRDPCQTTFHT